MRKRIPTHLITGFLGTGKTTAILELLRQNQALMRERWAVLVNEFGEVGIDGALLLGSGAEIREVAGGCMCCVAGLPMKVALNTLIAKTKPDRLLIETTGLGHPQALVDTLTGEFYGDVLDLRAIIALVDPRKLNDPRYLEHPIFRDQLAIADVIVANKTDLCSAEDQDRFDIFTQDYVPPKQRIGWATQGEFPLDWLDLAHGGQRVAPAIPPRKPSLLELPSTLPEPIELRDDEEFARRENTGDGYFSCGWLFADHIRFDQGRLFGLMMGLPVDRLKGVLKSGDTTFVFNHADGVLSITETAGDHENLLEIIHREKLDWQLIEDQLLQARM
ncbi:MAG: GTP-binding protein [Spongiibacteraceae bacterium]